MCHSGNILAHRVYTGVSHERAQLRARYFKPDLPGPHGEVRTRSATTAATDTCVVPFRGHQLGLLICEDLGSRVCAGRQGGGAELLLTINASHDQENPGSAMS